MQTVRSLKDLNALITGVKAAGKSVGFVPTMGFLHQGHISLVQLAKSQNDFTIASIYVNPSQFNDAKDFENYPKDEEGDLTMLEENGCDAVFIPDQKEIESLNKISVDLEGVDEVLEGKFRPGHFKGVVEVVYRLFSAVTPDKAYFGEKDFQQLMVIKKMVQQAGLRVQIIGAPIIRESSGLAMSSRNSRLSQEGREKAGFIYETLKSYSNSDRSQLERFLAANGFELEYLEQYDFGSENRLFIAGFFEGVRLIDNVELN